MSFPLFAPRRPMEPAGPPASGEGAPSLSPARAAMPTNTRVSRVIGPGAAAHGRGREALALVLWTAAVFSLLALASFQGTPPTALGQDGLPLPSVAGEDWVGPVGESWARGIVHLFGVIGWTVPFELAALGVPLVRGRQSELTPPRLAGDLLIAIVFAALVQVGWPTTEAFGHYGAAGVVGELFGEVMRSLFSTVGSFLVGASLLGLILIARASFSFIALVRLIVFVVTKVVGFFTGGVASIAAAWRSAKEIEASEVGAKVSVPRIELTPFGEPMPVSVGAGDGLLGALGAATGFDGDDVFDEPPAKRRGGRKKAEPGAPASGVSAVAAPVAVAGTAPPPALRNRNDVTQLSARGVAARPRIRVEMDAGERAATGAPASTTVAPLASITAAPAATSPTAPRGRGRATALREPGSAAAEGPRPSTRDASAAAASAEDVSLDLAPADLGAPEEEDGRPRRARAPRPAPRKPMIVDTSEDFSREEADLEAIADAAPPMALPSYLTLSPSLTGNAPAPAARPNVPAAPAAPTSEPASPEPTAAAKELPKDEPKPALIGSGVPSHEPRDASAIAPPPPMPKPAVRKVVVRKQVFKLPPMDLLDKSGAEATVVVDEEALGRTAELLTKTLADYGVSGKVEEIVPGPTVTTFEVSPVAGTKVSKVAGLADDLALALGKRVRIVAPIPGKTRIGFELENPERMVVKLRDLCDDRRFFALNSPLPVVLGRDIRGRPVYADLAAMPHVIVAGATGAGKSVGLNVMLTSLLYRRTPDELKLLMIDPKVVELAPFDRIPHMLLPVVTDMKQAATALKWAVDEMERRYQLFGEAGTKNIDTYNGYCERVKAGELKNPLPKTVAAKDFNGFEEQVPVGDGEEGEQQYPERLPHIVIVVDEFADLMMQQGKDVEAAVARLAQKARAAGMHVILATQRPSVNVITGMIKANFPTRIAFRVAQKVDSRTILDEQGAEHLLGKGDMLIKLNGTNETRRVQCPWVSESEVQAVTDFLRSQGSPVYDLNILKPRDEEGGGSDAEDEEADELYDAAVRIVAETRRCSTSWLQRKLEIGYNRAARMVEMMERNGVVGPANGAKDREVLISSL